MDQATQSHIRLQAAVDRFIRALAPQLPHPEPSRARHLERRALFFFNETATTEIYTLSLHDALPISGVVLAEAFDGELDGDGVERLERARRSEEHTSELQSPDHLVCRLLLEKKK